MATTLQPNAMSVPVSEARPIENIREAAVPWYMWCAVFAVTSIMIGGQWDISWHQSIGRDTFWTPAHMAIYLGGVLSGVAFGFLILHTTFSRRSPLKESSVHIWGFSGPLGAFIAAWGGITMLTSAPFDNWWHNAYGLDVEIISPPHVVLFLGIYAIVLGTLVLICGHTNRMEAKGLTAESKRSRGLFLYVAGLLLTLLMLMLMAKLARPTLHSSSPYIVMAVLTPISLTLGSRVTKFPFAATIVAGIYTFVNIALIQIMPLFPAEPKLGPVYQHVTGFVPPPFPIVLLIPALALDLFWRRTSSWNPWKSALFGGLIYTVLLILPEWFFASFLMSPAAAKPFWGTTYLYYALPPNSFMARNLFFNVETPTQLWFGFLMAAVGAVLSIRWATSRGAWMSSVKR
jgi:hypothetical protein